MAKSGGNQKLRILYLYELLFTETDEAHPLTREELCQKLLSRYDIEVERKTFYDDIAYLQKAGADIAKGEGRGTYFLASRAFEPAELHLLASAVQSSQFLSEKKGRALIEKLTTLCSRFEGADLRRGLKLAPSRTSANEGIFYNIDAIYQAITKGKQISFLYYNWDYQNGKIEKYYRKDGAHYVVSPWALSWQDEKYYLIAFDEAADALRHYRIDKMEKIELSHKARIGGEAMDNFDSVAYTSKHFSMYGGEEQQVTLRFKKELLGVAVDQFGAGGLRPDDADHFLLITNVVLSPQFYGFLFSLEDGVELLAPEEAVCQMKETLTKIQQLYN